LAELERIFIIGFSCRALSGCARRGGCEDDEDD
jgi:hypothetical protein